MTQTHDILDRLIAFPTVSSASNLEMVDYLQDFLTTRSFRVIRVGDDSGQKAGLFAALGPDGPGGILLSGHTDVVPAEGQAWTRDPFRLVQDGGRLYGRGTTDMKGYLASILALADRAKDAPLKEPLKLALSYDEEIGCVGIKQMIDQLEPAIGLPRACLVGEPTSMQIATGHKGKAALRAICHGQNGHSALSPNFVNALHLAGDFMGQLRALQDDLAQTGARDEAYGVPYSTVHVGKLSGGTALNIVPDRAELAFEYRHLAADAPDMLHRRIATCAEMAAAPHRAQFPDARIEVEEVNAYPGLDMPVDGAFVAEARELAGETGLTKVAFGTEAGYFHGLGIPTVVCGPGSMEGQGHKPDEYVEVDQLAACDAMMDRVLDSLTG